jgi:hypothetical protein
MAYSLPHSPTRRSALSLVASVVFSILIVAAVIGGYGLGRLSAPASTLIASSTLLTTGVNSTTFTLISYSVRTATNIETVTSTITTALFPQNEVVTERIIQATYFFYPIVIAENCGQVGGGSISLSTGTFTSYVATTSAALGTTLTLTLLNYTINTSYTLTENSLAVTYTITNSTTTYTSIHCEAIS